MTETRGGVVELAALHWRGKGNPTALKARKMGAFYVNNGADVREHPLQVPPRSPLRGGGAAVTDTVPTGTSALPAEARPRPGPSPPPQQVSKLGDGVGGGTVRKNRRKQEPMNVPKVVQEETTKMRNRSHASLVLRLVGFLKVGCLSPENQAGMGLGRSPREGKGRAPEDSPVPGGGRHAAKLQQPPPGLWA